MDAVSAVDETSSSTDVAMEEDSDVDKISTMVTSSCEMQQVDTFETHASPMDTDQVSSTSDNEESITASR